MITLLLSPEKKAYQTRAGEIPAFLCLASPSPGSYNLGITTLSRFKSGQHPLTTSSQTTTDLFDAYYSLRVMQDLTRTPTNNWLLPASTTYDAALNAIEFHSRQRRQSVNERAKAFIARLLNLTSQSTIDSYLLDIIRASDVTTLSPAIILLETQRRQCPQEEVINKLKQKRFNLPVGPSELLTAIGRNYGLGELVKRLAPEITANVEQGNGIASQGILSVSDLSLLFEQEITTIRRQGTPESQALAAAYDQNRQFLIEFTESPTPNLTQTGVALVVLERACYLLRQTPPYHEIYEKIDTALQALRTTTPCEHIVIVTRNPPKVSHPTLKH